MTAEWITPAVVSAAGLLGAAGGTWVAKFIGRTFRRATREVVAEVLASFKQELDVRFDHNDAKTNEAADKADLVKLEMARQFGGNGGGIRQAINELTADVAYLKGAAASATTSSSTVVR